MTEAEKRAMQHPDKLGAGAKARRHLKGQSKVHVVMREYARGTLHSSSGAKVTSRKQAIAIAMSEAGLSRKKDKGFYGHTTCQTLF